MKSILHCSLLSALCISSSVFANEDTPANALDRVLRSAEIGTPFSDFVAAHQEAVYSDQDIRDIQISPDRPGALLLTHDSDPFLGLNAFANIGFRDDALYELVAVWTGLETSVCAQRRRFFTAVIQRHGQSYDQETILVHPHTAEERPAAVFLWRQKDAAILAFYTPPSPLDAHPKASLTYAVFTSNDPFLNDILEKHPASDEQHEQAWESLADVMPFIEALKQEP